jgi:hypothetical protein
MTHDVAADFSMHRDYQVAIQYGIAVDPNVTEALRAARPIMGMVIPLGTVNAHGLAALRDQLAGKDDVRPEAEKISQARNKLLAGILVEHDPNGYQRSRAISYNVLAISDKFQPSPEDRQLIDKAGRIAIKSEVISDGDAKEIARLLGQVTPPPHIMPMIEERAGLYFASEYLLGAGKALVAPLIFRAASEALVSPEVSSGTLERVYFSTFIEAAKAHAPDFFGVENDANKLRLSAPKSKLD